MKLVVVGARADGLAHVVLDLVAEGGEHEVVAFVDDTPDLWNTEVFGIPVIGPPSGIGQARLRGAKGAVIAIGSPQARERLAPFLHQAGLRLPALVHPSAHVARSVTVGRGVLVGAMATVISGAVLEDLVVVSPGAFVSHHVHVGSCTLMAGRSITGGRCRLGRRVQFGLGATLLPDRTVGDDAIVGAGAVVVEDVAPGVTVAGVPARPLRDGGA